MDRPLRSLPFVLALGSVCLTGPPALAAPTVADRAVVRFTAPETGGIRAPRFVFERVLAFEARLEALADPGYEVDRGVPYRDRHVRSALERHIAETLLASLRIDPEPTEADLLRQTGAARLVLVQRVGSPQALADAARAEGISDWEVLGMLRRQARASLYLDRMVAPMLKPSDPELRAIHRTVQTPYRDRPFAEVAPELRRWYVARRLAVALASFYQNARSRLTVTLLDL
jgi:hypothetical protein